MNLNKILLDPESMIVIAIIELHNRLRHGGLGYDSIKSTLMNMLYSDLQSFKLTPEDVNALVTVIVVIDGRSLAILSRARLQILSMFHFVWPWQGQKRMKRNIW